MLLRTGLLLALMVFHFESTYARCNGHYADHLLEKRFTGCVGDIKEVVHNWDASSNNYALSNAVRRVCMNGCYSFVIDNDLESECNKQYAAALSMFKLESVATSAGCQDRGSYSNTSAASNSNVSADVSCKWEARATLDLTCGGGSRNTSICGQGRAICSGVVLCAQPFRIVKENYSAAQYTVSCLTETGKCEGISIAKCMSDNNISTFADETITTKSAQEKNQSKIK